LLIEEDQQQYCLTIKVTEISANLPAAAVTPLAAGEIANNPACQPQCLPLASDS
jgi:hypothetical protein